jgi:LuxR family transcriptional regulator, maltose regulon positive regulatory protein
MQKTGTLIRTKLRLPFTRTGLVTRERLQERVTQGLRAPLTLVTAPAGFGKTTLVASCIAAGGMPVAWLSLDKNDNQTGRFLTYLAAALQGADPSIGGEAAQMLAASPQSPFEVVLTSLINDLDLAAKEIILVLDDYQFISSQAVHDALAFLLEHCPSTLHLVIASRSDPPLPLSRLRARGQVLELRAVDLRFTEAEAAQFLNEVMDLSLDPGAVVVLAERTEGWIAGLQMASIALQSQLSMRDHEDVGGFIESFSGTNRYILDYLLEEVLNSQPPEIQQFLLYTSILERLAAPLCDALLNATQPTAVASPPLESGKILEHLDRSHLFLVSLDDERLWYRYHHLFADLLRARLEQGQPDLVPHLHLRASAWLEGKGFIAEAIQHLFAAGEISRAAELIERYGPAHLADGDPSVFQQAAGLPREVLIARPKLGLYLAWLLIIHSHIERAIPLLIDLAGYLASPESSPGLGWMQTYIASALAFLAPPSSPPESYPLPAYEQLDEIPAGELVLRNAADFLYGMALARRGELERAIEVALKCIHREKSPQRGAAIPTLAPFLTRVYLMEGRLHDCASLCREYLDPIQERGIRFVYTAGSMKIDLGEALYEWNYLEEAEGYIRDGLRDNELWRNIMTDGFGSIALARLLQAKGDYAGAMQIVEKFETWFHSHLRTPREFDEDLRCLRARIQLASGDFQSAYRWADQLQHSEDFKLNKELYTLILARIRLAQGRYAEVEQMLAGKTPQFSAGSRITRQLESNLLQAAGVAGQQRLPEAFEWVEASLSLAEPEGYIRVFLDVGEPARELLAAYLRSDAFEHQFFAQKVLDTFPVKATVSHAPQAAGLIEQLSARELEVLQHIALGQTNQEIARQLFVSSGTVKAHTSSIYRKLNAANRTEAVGVARELGIIS